MSLVWKRYRRDLCNSPFRARAICQLRRVALAFRRSIAKTQPLVKQIVVIGDEVTMDYLPVARNALAALAEIWTPGHAVGSTTQALEGLRDWVLKRQPDVALFAVGRSDTRKLCFGECEHLTPLRAFERNVHCILRLVQERSTTVPIWATITPVDRRRIAPEADAGGSEFGYDNETISLYNEEAKEVAAKLGVATLDLYGYVKAASRADSIRPHGIRFNERGSDYIARKVVETLRSYC